MICVGLDLAWSDRNPTAGCAVDSNGSIVDEATLTSDDAIIGWIATHSPTAIAIDAPLLVPNATGMRPCERDLHRVYGSRGAGAHPANRTLLERTCGRIRGEDLVARLPDHGDPWSTGDATVLEVYPHPGLIETFGLPRRLAYKRVPAAQRPGALRELRDLLATLEAADPPLRGPWVDIPGDVGGRRAKAVEDRLDARFCAWAALVWALYGPGRIRLFGDASSGHIAVPIPVEPPGRDRRSTA